MEVEQQIYNELVEIQKKNAQKRHDYFVELARRIRPSYEISKQDFDRQSNNSFIEFARPYFPPVEFEELVEEGVFDE